MANEDDLEDPPARRARLKAARRSRKRGPRPMVVRGKSVFVLKRLIDARARAARRRKRQH